MTKQLEKVDSHPIQIQKMLYRSLIFHRAKSADWIQATSYMSMKLSCNTKIIYATRFKNKTLTV